MRTFLVNTLLFSCLFSSSAAVPKRCSAPEEYPHTRLAVKFSSRQQFSHGEKVYYRCAEDFSPSRGVPVAQCVDGAWTKLTLKCEKRSCGNAGDLQNGHFLYEGNSYIGERAYAECNEGYTLKGLNYLICKRSGWTGEFPTCEEASTKAFPTLSEAQGTCSSPSVDKSDGSSRDISVYQLGESINFTCSHGFQLDGAQRITCGPGGQWHPGPPRCLPSPDKSQSPEKEGGCGVPEIGRGSNVGLADRYITMTSFSSGDKVYYVCDVGYVPAGGSRYRRCREGKWSPLSLKCERQLCGPAGEIMYGQFMYTGDQFGDTATAVCDEGYRLVGQAQKTCMSRGWDGHTPICEAVTCDDPPQVKKADMTGTVEPPYTYRKVIGYKCRVGVLTGASEIWCTKNGTWSHPPPKCREIKCRPPNVPHAHWRRSYVVEYQPRDTVTMECDPGYFMLGSGTVTCGTGGRWMPRLPRCARRRKYIF